MLAAFTVNVAYDTITTDTDNAVITLREAVFRANQTQAHDTILFHPNLTGKTITLGKDAAGADLNLGSEAGELKITEAVTIDAQGKDITIDASGNDNTPGVNDGQGSRVFNLEITALAGETQKVTLDGLTITGGDTAVGMSDPGPGGGIHLKGGGAGNVSFVIRNSKITGNASTGRGGGIFSENSLQASLLIENSEISGNTAGTSGGGVFAWANSVETDPFPETRAITISRSLISGNTAGIRGGGLYTRNFDGTRTLVEDTQITDNFANDTFGGKKSGNGGGIYVYLWDTSAGDNLPRFTISQSVVDNNHAVDLGGGIFVCSKINGEFIAANSTVSTNSTLSTTGSTESGRGGGIFIGLFAANESADAFLSNVTVTQNSSLSGGGVEIENLDGITTRINNSIISENFDQESPPQPSNLKGRVDIVNTLFNLIGSDAVVLMGADPVVLDLAGQAATLDPSNIITDAPLLSALGDHGGYTPTHRPLTGSPAIDAGLNALAIDPFTTPPTVEMFDYDQRGKGFDRFYDVPGIPAVDPDPLQTVDIGAYEINLPKVIEVVISNSTEAHSYVDAVRDTSQVLGNQLRALRFSEADTIAITFSEPVTLSPTGSELELRSILAPSAYGTVYVEANAAGTTHTWELDPNNAQEYQTFGQNTTTYNPDQILLILSDDIQAASADQAALDGEWINPNEFNPSVNIAAISRFPSGDGVAGGEFRFVFTTFIPGDFDNNNYGSWTDIDIVMDNWGAPRGDFQWVTEFAEANGMIGQADLNLALASLGINLRSAELFGDLDGNGIINMIDFWDLLDLDMSGSISSAEATLLANAIWYNMDQWFATNINPDVDPNS